MNNYEFVLTSYDGCDEFVVEIWYQESPIAIVKENNELELVYENANIEIITNSLSNI